MTIVFGLMLVPALLFFLFLPITDRRTVMMKLAMMTAMVMLFTGSVAMVGAPSLTAHLPQIIAMGRN